MAIQSIGLNLINKNINFGKKHNKETIIQKESKNEQKVPMSKMYPAMLAMAGLVTLNSCSDEYSKFTELNKVKNEYYDVNNSHSKEDALALENIKTYNISNEKDSISSENEYFKFSAVRIKSNDHTLIFANGERKADGKKFSAVSKYDKDGQLLNSIISEPGTDEKYFVKYSENGEIDTIKNKNGETVTNDEKVTRALLIFALSVIGLGIISQPIQEQRR